MVAILPIASICFQPALDDFPRYIAHDGKRRNVLIHDCPRTNDRISADADAIFNDTEQFLRERLRARQMLVDIYHYHAVEGLIGKGQAVGFYNMDLLTKRPSHLLDRHRPVFPNVSPRPGGATYAEVVRRYCPHR